jgi:light-regulated signal transduction histidine kinase (bacteriophytochrome)
VFLLLAGAATVSLWLLVRVVRGAAALGRVNQQLAESHHRLELRAGELARSNAELEQFASVASHDLQEPLRKVQTFGEQLETKYGSVLPDDGLDHLRRMRNASARMQSLIDDLLSFARVTTRVQPFERVELHAIAQEVAGDLEVYVEALGANLEIGPLPGLEADPLQMRQLLQNLMANALKFHRPDVAPRVRVEGDQRAGAAVITVSDNGIGFEDRHRERIFRVFERLHGRTSYDGTGIGLALCRRIVERHGGTISARGVAGEGATFTIVLPLEHVDAGRREPTGPPQAAAEERKEPAHVG